MITFNFRGGSSLARRLRQRRLRQAQRLHGGVTTRSQLPHVSRREYLRAREYIDSGPRRRRNHMANGASQQQSVHMGANHRVARVHQAPVRSNAHSRAAVQQPVFPFLIRLRLGDLPNRQFHTMRGRNHPPSIRQGNFSAMPFEIARFFENHPEFFARDNPDQIDLPAVRNVLNTWAQHSGQIVSFFRTDRRSPNFNVNNFLRNEYLKMKFPPRRQQRDGTRFCQMTRSATDPSLKIPTRDVFDLPDYICLYILDRLTHLSERHPTFSLQYQIVTSPNALRNGIRYIPRRDLSDTPIRVVDRKISSSDFSTLYNAIIMQFANTIPGASNDTDAFVTWQGSEGSGTRIRLYNYANDVGDFYLRILAQPAQSVNLAHGWTQQVEDLLSKSVGTSVISVRNRDDNKCLIYCVIIGVIMKLKNGGSRVFGVGRMMVEPSEVYAKGMYMFTDDEDPITALIHRLCRLLMPPTYSSGELDSAFSMIDDLDKRAGTTLSITDFREEFEKIEKLLIPQNECGIDVYGMDFNVNPHIYPMYMSSNRTNTIDLLCVTPLDARCSHYCAIVNLTNLLRMSGGKQFFSCTKCGQCFYHRRLLAEHHCKVDPRHYEVDGMYGYHYSTNEAMHPDIVGACPKCRLCFTDVFFKNYHEQHCLMKGHTGYRHVQLVSYKPDDQPTLDGQEVDYNAEEKHELERYIMYADFECSIDPETGEHNFMSYGIYNYEAWVYETGYSLDEFMNYILDVAYEDEVHKHFYVYFHNAMGYDANFILRYVLANPECATWGIQVIMKSTNRLQKLVFHTRRGDKTRIIHIGDTFLFLTLSLERIVGSIRKDDDVQTNKENFDRFFHCFHKRYPDVSEMEIDHILRKNIFPYKFFTDSGKLNTNIRDFLAIFEPRQENLKYFSERITLEDLRKGYADTKHVVETFHCNDARDYHDLYLCCDVLQLADVFTRSMHILWESHHIHLTRYLGMPSASWAAFLRYDPTMSIPLYNNTFFAEFFKEMIRGGITSAALRHAVADDTHSIIYLDVNGLYPYVMQAYDFPCGEMKFISCGWSEEMAKVRLEECFRNFERDHQGMCFCVDLHIPPDVKEMTDMYPFAPEHRKIFQEYYEDVNAKKLTPFLKRWSEANNGEMMQEFTGLVCTLYDKEKYNVHWRLLKFYMEHGVVVKKVWYGVQFDEGDYLAGYIRMNINIRNNRKDELGKTLYKLLGNSIYGKTFESPFKRNTYEIIRAPAKLQGLIEEGNIAAVTPIDDLGWIVRMDGEDIILDKPTYIGACVCEFSKLHMYTLLYDKLMKLFPSSRTPDGKVEKGCELVYTDTDSFIVRVKHPDGVGPSPTELFSYIKSRDPTLIGGIGGQVKSETGEDDTIQEVIALRSKVYAYITKNGHIGKRAKGTTYDAQEMQLDWETYKHALESLTSIDTRNVQFVRETFKIASLDVYRQSLSVNDGKRFICEDGIHTHAFGY